MGSGGQTIDRTRPREGAPPHPYARLDPDAVIAAVESTGRISDMRILALNSYENRVYQVGIEDAVPVIVKFYRPGRWSRAQIDEEHRFTRLLYEHEIPVVPPLEIEPGAEFPTLGRHGEFDFAIYPRQGGRAPELDDLEHLHQLGRFIGRIHAVGAGFEFRWRESITVGRARADADYLLDADFVPYEIESAYRAIADDVVAAIETRPPDAARYRQISLHGDVHSGNLLWRDQRPHFVDFDDCRRGPAIQDLWMLLSGEADERQRQLLKIVDGYNLFFSFDPAELTLIGPLTAMRVLNFHSWIARRWDDPAFPQAFPWFDSPRYWSDHILELKEMLSLLQEPPLQLPRA